jgi:F0F1-type ATP synthase assembly protein I
MRRAGPYLGIGSTFLASILVCLFGGWWLDGILGTSPWLTVAGAFLGIVLGFYLFLRIVLGHQGSGGVEGGS